MTGRQQGILMLLGFALLVVTAWAVHKPESKTPRRSDAPRSAPLAPSPRRCVLKDTWVFPELDGARELFNALLQQDELALTTAVRANGGASVQAGTRCTRIEEIGGVLDVYYARIRVLEGPHAGTVGWVRSRETEQ